MTKKRILYAGNFRLFPADAAGQRVLALARLLHETGHVVELIPGLGPQLPEGTCFCSETNYDDTSFKDALPEPSIKSLIRRLSARPGLQAVILYNPSNVQVISARALSIIFGFRLIGDLTEWYEYSHLPSMKAKAEVIVRMNLSYRLFRRMILISDYLRDYYNRPHSILIPPLIETDPTTKPKPGPENGEPVRVLYAGFPGKKDKIEELIRWLDEVADDIQAPVEIYLAGPNPEMIRHIVTASQNLKVYALGQIERHQVYELYRMCHLSGIIRDNCRYEWAGFPTKSVEGWSMGTPALVLSHSRFANLAKQYDAVAVLDEHDPAGSLRNILTGIAEHPESYTHMSENALRLAREHHSGEKYKRAIQWIVS